MKQEQIDLMILEQVANGMFELILDYSEHSRAIERNYKSRGFNVRSTEFHTTISWRNPHLDKMQQPNKYIFSHFTAQQIYYLLTKGKDLRHLTNSVVYQSLIREKQIIETYSMDKIAVYNLFNEAITQAEEKGCVVTISDHGAITSNKNNDFNVNEIRNVNNDETKSKIQDNSTLIDPVELIN